jgi:hypothetical protein
MGNFESFSLSVSKTSWASSLHVQTTSILTMHKKDEQ